MSVKDNLQVLRESGLDSLIEIQYQEHRCSRCDGLISVHNRKCFKCDTITRLVEKRGKEY